LPRCILDLGQDHGIHSMADFPKYSLEDIQTLLDNMPFEHNEDLDREVSLILFIYISSFLHNNIHYYWKIMWTF
jgi:hypothetical protein